MKKATPAPLLLLVITLSVAACDRYPAAIDDTVVEDVDGNVYRVVRIGDRFWMAENLRTTRYRNGDFIPSGLDDEEWAVAGVGAYAIHPHTAVPGIGSEEAMLAAYGALYNWLAGTDPRGLCPTGWHVPGDAEWMQLETRLGMTVETAMEFGARGTTEGGTLKATRTAPDPHPRWGAPNTGATDEIGWSALPGGVRSGSDGSFQLLGEYGYWWSATEHPSQEMPGYSWTRHIHFSSSTISRGGNHQSAGYSVRCIRASPAGEDSYS